MQAIEFETRITNRSVHLPRDAQVADGQQVRVVVLYEHPAQTDVSGTAGEVQAGAIARLMRDPLRLAGFTPLSRDEAHER